MKFLLDPRLFNFVILVMFAGAAVRWSIARNWPQAGYWAASFALNLCITAMGKS